MRASGRTRKRERERGIDDGSDYGKNIGTTSATLVVIQLVLSCIPFISLCGSVLGLVGFVMWIVFWVKIAGYSRQLAADTADGGSSRRRLERFDDYDDDYGRPRERPHNEGDEHIRE